MTLSRPIRGLCVLKALILVHRQLGHHLPWASPHVSLERDHVDTRDGNVSFQRLIEVFVALLWVFGPLAN
jgi:hypothetical protein